jgi:hypothetical protein
MGFIESKGSGLKFPNPFHLYKMKRQKPKRGFLPFFISLIKLLEKYHLAALDEVISPKFIDIGS